MMIVLNKEQHIIMVSRQTISPLPAIVCWQQLPRRHQDGYYVDGADCCLIGIVLGVTMKKNIPRS